MFKYFALWNFRHRLTWLCLDILSRLGYEFLGTWNTGVGRRRKCAQLIMWWLYQLELDIRPFNSRSCVHCIILVCHILFLGVHVQRCVPILVHVSSVIRRYLWTCRLWLQRHVSHRFGSIGMLVWGPDKKRLAWDSLAVYLFLPYEIVYFVENGFLWMTMAKMWKYKEKRLHSTCGWLGSCFDVMVGKSVPGTALISYEFSNVCAHILVLRLGSMLRNWLLSSTWVWNNCCGWKGTNSINWLVSRAVREEELRGLSTSKTLTRMLMWRLMTSCWLDGTCHDSTDIIWPPSICDGVAIHLSPFVIWGCYTISYYTNEHCLLSVENTNLAGWRQRWCGSSWWRRARWPPTTRCDRKTGNTGAPSEFQKLVRDSISDRWLEPHDVETWKTQHESGPAVGLGQGGDGMGRVTQDNGEKSPDCGNNCTGNTSCMLSIFRPGHGGNLAGTTARYEKWLWRLGGHRWTHSI